MRGFAHPSAAPRLAREGGRAARSPLVEARREAVGVGARPPSRAFWKRLETGWSDGRSPAWRRAEPRFTKGGQTRGSLSLLGSCWLVGHRRSKSRVRSSLVVGRESHRRPGPALVARRAACRRRRGREAQQSRRELTDYARGPRSDVATQGRGE